MWIYKPFQMKIDLNHKVLDLFEVYNFGIKLIFIRLHIKSYEFDRTYKCYVAKNQPIVIVPAVTCVFAVKVFGDRRFFQRETCFLFAMNLPLISRGFAWAI
jgi:hypothetical protein